MTIVDHPLGARFNSDFEAIRSDMLLIPAINPNLPEHPDDSFDCKTISLDPDLLSTPDTATKLTQNSAAIGRS